MVTPQEYDSLENKKYFKTLGKSKALWEHQVVGQSLLVGRRRAVTNL